MNEHEGAVRAFPHGCRGGATAEGQPVHGAAARLRRAGQVRPVRPAVLRADRHRRHEAVVEDKAVCRAGDRVISKRNPAGARA